MSVLSSVWHFDIDSCVCDLTESNCAVLVCVWCGGEGSPGGCWPSAGVAVTMATGNRGN